MKNAKLVKDYGKQRYYELDFNVVNFKFSKPKKIEDIKLMEGKLRPGWYIVNDVSKSTNIICISDANTHIERLVFAGFLAKNKETGEEVYSCSHTPIGGQITMLIHGGDIDSVHDDEVYIRHLRMLNNKPLDANK